MQNAGEDGKIFFDHTHDIYGAFVNESRYAIRVAEVTWLSVAHYLLGEQYPEATKDDICTTDSIDEARQLITSRGFIQRAKWDVMKDEYLYRALVAKFLQHLDLEQLLFETGNRDLVYASPADSYYGIGPKGYGHNMLGRLLMQVRRKFERLQLDYLWGAGSAHRLEQAEAEAEDDPDDTFTLTRLAQTYVEVGQFEWAVIAARRSLTKSSFNEEWNYKILAYSLERLGKNKEAIDCLKQLVRLDPEEQNYLNWLARALANVGKNIPAKFFADRARLLEQKNKEFDDDGSEKW